MKRYIISVTHGDEVWTLKMFAESSTDALTKSLALKGIQTKDAKIVIEEDPEFNYNISEAV